MNASPLSRFRSRGLVLLAALALAARLAAAPALPPDLEARRAELQAVSEEGAAWRARVGPRINEAIRLVPAFVREHLAVQGVDLSTEERRLLQAQGPQALAPQKAAVFQDAAPEFGAMKASLATYFQAYDRYQDAEIRLRCFGSVLSVLERRAGLEEHLSTRQRRKLDAALAELAREELEYRGFLADPEAKNHEISNSSDDVFYAAEALDDTLAALERKHGLREKVGFGARVGGMLRKLKQKARLVKIHATTVPAIGRMFAYLYNPFRKQPDPAKVAELLRFYSRSYRWAAGMELEVRGADRIPADAPVVFAFSHRSTIEDAVSMMAVVPDSYSFMVAQRAIPAFLNGKLINEPSIINVGGRKPDGSRVDAIEDGISSLRSGLDLAIFPEGTTPTPTKETRPLRHGIDVVTQAVGDEPVYIVPVTIDDPANGVDDAVKNVSEKGPMKVTVTFGSAIDPLKLRSVPAMGGEMLLDVIRAIWHRNLYRPDVQLEAEASAAETLGTLPNPRTDSFQALHGN